MQRSAPGLKNAQRRLTIRPPVVPTTETAKPILKQRKPPADPGPAPFKNAIFSKLIKFFGNLKNNRPAAERVCSRRPDLLLTAAAAASFSLLRAQPRRSLWLGSQGRSKRRTRARGRASAAGARGGCALAAVRPPRAGGAESACPRGAWGAGRTAEPAGGAATIPAPREPPPPSTHRAPSPPLAAGRSAERTCQHATRRASTLQWLQAPRTEDAPAASWRLRVAGLAQRPACSERSVGRENCSRCYCGLLRRGRLCV